MGAIGWVFGSFLVAQKKTSFYIAPPPRRSRPRGRTLRRASDADVWNGPHANARPWIATRNRAYLVRTIEGALRLENKPNKIFDSDYLGLP
jgi:hypothetical protein